MSTLPTLFPDITPDYILSFQFSSWYPKFARISVKSTIIKPLSEEFRLYLDSDSVFVPEGSEDLSVQSMISSWLDVNGFLPDGQGALCLKTKKTTNRQMIPPTADLRSPSLMRRLEHASGRMVQF